MKSSDIKAVKCASDDIVKIVSGGWYYGKKLLKEYLPS